MKLRDFLLLVFLTIFFSFLIFFVKSYFFWWIKNFENEIIEENYIDPVAILDSIIPVSLPQVEEETLKEEVWNIETNNTIETIVEENLSSAVKVKYTYVPKSFWSERAVVYYSSVYNEFLNYKPIGEKISLLDVMLYKQKWEVRWKMQNKKVKLFWIYEMDLSEFLAVSIHEFAHFLDLYILQKKNWVDVSDYFYDISWEETTILKSPMAQKDFVSGYAMTNKYEDFAETFWYYILHNSDFLEKSKKSSVLKQKYDYFKKYLFGENEFIDSLLKWQEEIKDYYRDTTKIWYSLQNFLQYLKKWV
jgi:hypothetical protein